MKKTKAVFRMHEECIPTSDKNIQDIEKETGGCVGETKVLINEEVSGSSRSTEGRVKEIISKDNEPGRDEASSYCRVKCIPELQLKGKSLKIRSSTELTNTSLPSSKLNLEVMGQSIVYPTYPRNEDEPIISCASNLEIVGVPLPKITKASDETDQGEIKFEQEMVKDEKQHSNDILVGETEEKTMILDDQSAKESKKEPVDNLRTETEDNSLKIEQPVINTISAFPLREEALLRDVTTFKQEVLGNVFDKQEQEPNMSVTEVVIHMETKAELEVLTTSVSTVQEALVVHQGCCKDSPPEENNSIDEKTKVDCDTSAFGIQEPKEVTQKCCQDITRGKDNENVLKDLIHMKHNSSSVSAAKEVEETKQGCCEDKAEMDLLSKLIHMESIPDKTVVKMPDCVDQKAVKTDEEDIADKENDSKGDQDTQSSAEDKYADGNDRENNDCEVANQENMTGLVKQTKGDQDIEISDNENEDDKIKDKDDDEDEEDCCDSPDCEKPRTPPPKNIDPIDASIQVPDQRVAKKPRKEKDVTGGKERTDPGKAGIEKVCRDKIPDPSAVDDFDVEEISEIRDSLKKRMFVPQKVPPYDTNTGFLSDGKRRVDFVLVMNVTLSTRIKSAQLEFLANAAKMGFVIEIDNPVVPRNKHLQFIKLHATDVLLENYAETFRVRKFYRENHTQYIHRFKKMPFYEDNCYKRERENLKIIRSKYKEPLKLSNLDRSYVVYLLLRCLPFGRSINHCGLTRMLNNKLIVAAYALHDGPYYHPQQRGFTKFNYRQILYLFWAGIDNCFKYQPVNLVYEYYGSKVAFYFVFYEFYNKALFVASFWGLFITILYFIKDADYLGDVRGYICAATLKTNSSYIKTTDIQCEECVGVSRDNRCPMKHIKEQCFDMHLLRIADSPYIVLYSIGMSLWAIFFFFIWNRIEYYYVWLWEEGFKPRHSMVRPEVEKSHYTQRNTVRFGKEMGQSTVRCLAAFARGIVNYALATVTLLILVLLILAFIYLFTEFIRPLSVKSVKAANLTSEARPLPTISRKNDFVTLSLAVLVTCIIMYGLEKLFHYISLKTTRFQKYLLYKKYEEALIVQYFSISFLYGLILVIYFAWLKGMLYVSPVELEDMVIKMPLIDFSKNISESSKKLNDVLVRFLTWNCGGFLSCFREAISVYFVVVIFRILLVTVGEAIFVAIMDLVKKRRVSSTPVPTTEREFSLRPVTEEDIVVDMNKLMIQLALITLFSSLFPLAPILALFRNILHIRRKASAYITRTRRVVVLRSKGIESWNVILMTICFATPLFHAITLTHTAISKKYVYYKNTPDQKEKSFTRYLLDGVIDREKLKPINNRFSDDTSKVVKSCHVDGVTKKLKSETQFPWDYLLDNRTNSYNDVGHYKLKFFKGAFVYVFLHVFILLIVSIYVTCGVKPREVARIATRERRLRTMRLQYLRPFNKAAAAKDLRLNYAIPRKKSTEREPES